MTTLQFQKFDSANSNSNHNTSYNPNKTFDMYDTTNFSKQRESHNINVYKNVSNNYSNDFHI